jgi:hypothetical protein
MKARELKALGASMNSFGLDDKSEKSASIDFDKELLDASLPSENEINKYDQLDNVLFDQEFPYQHD